jgi:uncharacterized protein
MIGRPALPSEPPPDTPSRGPSMRPMNAALAGSWALGAILLLQWLLAITNAVRPAAAEDLVNGFGCQVAAYSLCLFLILRLQAPEASIREFLGVRATHPAFYGLGVLLGAALSAPVNALHAAIDRRWPSPDWNTTAIVDLYDQAPPWKRGVMGVILVVLVPVVEEVFYRGALLQPMRRRHRTVTAVAVAAALFAVAHIEWQMFLPILFVGLALGLLRVMSGSLVPSILLHATFNGIAFYAMAQPNDAVPETIPLSFVAGGAAAAVLLAGLVHQLGKRSALAARAQERDLR